MQIYKQKGPLILGLLAMLVTAFPAYGEGGDGNTYFNLGIGVQDFDTNRGLDSEAVTSIGLEHRYSDHWAVGLTLMDSEPETDVGNNQLDLQQIGIEGLYYFKDSNNSGIAHTFDPYGLIGVGQGEFDDGTSTVDETQISAGIGLRYLLSDHLSLKGEARLIHGDEYNDLDNIISVGISYAFGTQSAAPVDGDSDGDGVLDSRDQCRTTASGVSVDSDGCPLDSDGDGVADSQDNCPGTAAGVNVDSKGCPLDSDRDGVADNQDSCPSSASGATVDSKGCALDTDGDGVSDYVDSCPNTPTGREVDAKGCKFVLTRTEEVTLKVNFASNSSVVQGSQMAEIERVALFLRKYGDVSATIEGHTDDRGAAAYNETLSQRRADAVGDVLITRFGISGSRISAIGYGEARPIQTNATSAGRLANRRVIAVMKAQVSE